MFKMPLRAFSTVLGSLLSTGYSLSSTMRVRMPITMPTEEMSIGYIMELQPCALRSGEEAARTIAAHVDSAKDPNKSAPIPAISPTLSPTLSAMQAGFRKSSSSMPYSFLPERSAPTSA